MTVTRIATPHAYVGVSGDTKPTDGVPPGPTFVERDTGHEYIYDGTAWGQRWVGTAQQQHVALVVEQHDPGRGAGPAHRWPGSAISK